ncbi:MAG: OB-fold nucleic acid binding domain-containing protein [archaeon]
MFISDLKESMTNVELSAKVVELGQVRNVNTRFGPNKVSDAIIEDDTGKVKLTLWGNDIEKIKVGDKLKLTGGYVKSWQGELQVGVTRNGAMEVNAESGAAAPGKAAKPSGKPAAKGKQAEPEEEPDYVSEERLEDA